MEKITLHWEKCNDYPFLGWWCRFNSDILDDSRLTREIGPPMRTYKFDISGVYIIWAGVSNRTILKVGSGIIKDRFRKHLNDPEVLQYYSQGLYATWATIPLFYKSPNPFISPSKAFKDRMRGMEKYLSRVLAPVVLGERFPANVEMVEVNPPAWDPPVNPFLRAMSQSRHTQPNGSLEQLRKKQGNPFL